MSILLRALLTASCLLAGHAVAGERTVTLAVENVSCVACGPIVKHTLSRIPGVNRVFLAEQDGTATATATVSFDDTQVTPEALTTAVTNAGFPAHLQAN